MENNRGEVKCGSNENVNSLLWIILFSHKRFAARVISSQGIHNETFSLFWKQELLLTNM